MLQVDVVISETREAVRESIKLFLLIMADESGQDLIEYALVAALIALGAVASMRTLGGRISTAFTYIGTSLASAT